MSEINKNEMTMDERIKRINELYHLSKERELTDDEKAEQALHRRAYIDSIKSGLKVQLENIEIKELDGTIRKVKKVK